MKVYVCVQGLFEKSDSIGFDALYQWNLLAKKLGSSEDIRIFSENIDQELYPDINIEPIEQFLTAIAEAPDAIVIYHFCDGWPTFEQTLIEHCTNLVVRWHNNTPPWLLVKYAFRFAAQTVRGYTSILRLARYTACRFWCNSEFTARQLEILGVQRRRIDVVYPGSRYLDLPAARRVDQAFGADRHARLLFVSRIAPHKGHKHLLLTAAYLQQRLGIPAELTLPGRIDAGVPEYTSELTELAARWSIDLKLPGEVGPAQLDDFYRGASVFLCLSEHEGFGLPLFEAMRMGVPTAAWAHTATAELIRGHPLANSEMSPRWFAAAIATLQEPAMRAYVTRWQEENVLPQYTSARVLSQLAAALEHYGLSDLASGRDETPRQLPPYTDRRLEKSIKQKIRELCDRIGDEPVDGEMSIAREMPGNFMTLHDIEAYQALCAVNLIGGAPSPGGKTGDALSLAAGIFLQATRFSSTCGRIVEGKYLCPLASPEAHLIYGPYCNLTEGVYRVEFDLEVLDVTDPKDLGQLILDVVDNGSITLCRKIFSLWELKNGTDLALEFFHPRADSLIEFRIGVRKTPATRAFRSGTLSFAGVVLARAESARASRPGGEGLRMAIGGQAGSIAAQPRRLLAAILGRRPRKPPASNR